MAVPVTVYTGAVVVVWQMDLQLPVPIASEAMSSSPSCGKVYSIQHYKIKFVSDL